MDNRHLGTLVAIVAMACLAVIGAVGGAYLAGRDDPRPARTSTADGAPTTPGTATSGVSRPSGPDGASRPSGPGEPTDPVSPTRTASPSRSAGSSGEGRNRTYPINRLLHDEASTTIILVSATITGDSLRLNFRYRNHAPIAWPLSCPTAEVDRASSRITLADGQSVPPESTWCTATRPGQSFTLAPGAELDTWAIFPAVPAVGSSFGLSWYDFPEATKIELK